MHKNRDYPWDIYSLKELLHATNSFHHDNKIGEGGFGSVYWGRTSKGVEARQSCPSFYFKFHFLYMIMNDHLATRLSNIQNLVFINFPSFFSPFSVLADSGETAKDDECKGRDGVCSGS